MLKHWRPFQLGLASRVGPEKACSETTMKCFMFGGWGLSLFQTPVKPLSRIIYSLYVHPFS